jgi:hypothetical protein
VSSALSFDAIHELRQTVSATLKEGSVAADGGFEETVYLVRVNDGWMRVERLVRRGPIGGITATVRVEDDPSGVTSARRHDLKPRVYWKRETQVDAPMGTRFRKQIWTPNRERARSNPLLLRVPYDKHETEFELRADGLVSSKSLAEQAQREGREATRSEPSMTAEELSRNAAAVVAVLGNLR